jgi:outer membrane protein OmpA-like peptidoglycan-associated protein
MHTAGLAIVPLLLLGAACGSRSPAPPAGSAPLPQPVVQAPVTEPSPIRLADGIAVMHPDGYRAVHGQRRLELAARAGPSALRSEEIGYYLDVQQARLRQLGDAVATVERSGSMLVVRLAGGPRFESGSSRLTGEAREALAVVARMLSEYDATVVTLHGYTDATGSLDVNAELSEKRALAVARVLRAGGVAVERLLVVGHGQASPVASNEDEAGRARNRRVELHLDPVVR